MATITYTGVLSRHDYGEAFDILFLSSVESPLAEELLWMVGQTVSVRYWITDRQVTKEEAQTEMVRRVSGLASGTFQSHYSEITGYLWTEEELQIGGHNLLEELSSYVGKWLILEIEPHEKEP